MDLKERLSQVVGPEFVSDSPEDLEPYSRDYSLVLPAMPDYVVKPKTREEIQQVIKKWAPKWVEEYRFEDYELKD